MLCSFYGGNCTAGAGGHTHLPCWSTGTFPASVGPPHPVPMWMGAALVPSLFWGTQVPLKTGQVLQSRQMRCADEVHCCDSQAGKAPLWVRSSLKLPQHCLKLLNTPQDCFRTARDCLERQELSRNCTFGRCGSGLSPPGRRPGGSGCHPIPGPASPGQICSLPQQAKVQTRVAGVGGRQCGAAAKAALTGAGQRCSPGLRRQTGHTQREGADQARQGPCSPLSSSLQATYIPRCHIATTKGVRVRLTAARSAMAKRCWGEPCSMLSSAGRRRDGNATMGKPAAAARQLHTGVASTVAASCQPSAASPPLQCIFVLVACASPLQSIRMCTGPTL